MTISRRIKDNRVVRGIYFLFKNYFGVGRKGFIRLGNNTILTPPCSIGPIKNIEIGDNVGIGPHAYISTPNARVIIKGNCAIADHFTIHSGNHARLIGKFVTEITEENKPEGYDKDIVIDKDVWIGSNVTLIPQHFDLTLFISS